jgi:hypothetical protein
MQLLEELKEMRGCRKFKEEALDRTVWRTRFGRGHGSVKTLQTEWYKLIKKFHRAILTL